MDKAMLKSRTAWFNVIMAVLAFFPAVRNFVTPEIFTTIWGFGGLILRRITKTEVKKLI